MHYLEQHHDPYCPERPPTALAHKNPLQSRLHVLTDACRSRERRLEKVEWTIGTYEEQDLEPYAKTVTPPPLPQPPPPRLTPRQKLWARKTQQWRLASCA